MATEGREPLSRRMWGRRPGRPGECPLPVTSSRRGIEMEITFKGRHTSVPERFRRHATREAGQAREARSAARFGSTSRYRRNATRGRPTGASGWSSRSDRGARPSGPRPPRTTGTRPLTSRSPSSKGQLRRAAERRKVRRGDLTVRSTDALAAVAAAPADARPAARRPPPTSPSRQSRRPDDAASWSWHAGRPQGDDRRRERARPPQGRHQAEDAARRAVVPLPALPADDGGRTTTSPASVTRPRRRHRLGLLPMQMEGDGPLSSGRSSTPRTR